MQKTFTPEIDYYPTVRSVEHLPSAFPPLTSAEKKLEWGKELYLGLQFAQEFDLYRAITCYKRALFLCPGERKMQIEYHILEAYFLGKKYSEAIEFYEMSTLATVSGKFPALNELLLMLNDCYAQIGQSGKAIKILSVLQNKDACLAENVKIYHAVLDADFCELTAHPESDETTFVNNYLNESKSVTTARMLNAILPGAGYFYVSQVKSGVTSFVINALFTYAAYQFFDRGYVAAGIITTSLELGWYFGGINGAGIAAQEWNERLYESKGKNYLCQKRLFPIFMFSYVF